MSKTTRSDSAALFIAGPVWSFRAQNKRHIPQQAGVHAGDQLGSVSGDKEKEECREWTAHTTAHTFVGGPNNSDGNTTHFIQSAVTVA